MVYIVYFKSRKNFRDASTWAKEVCPKDATIDEIRQAAKLFGNEGFAVMKDGKAILEPNRPQFYF